MSTAATTLDSCQKSDVICFDMGTHVYHEMARPVELMPAHVTLMRLDSRVGSHMLDEAARQHELLSAQITLVGSFAGVRPHVNHPVPRPLERLAADRTRVRFHAGVGRDMRGQYVRPRELSTALIAAEWTFPGMGTHVGRQVAQ